MNIEISTEQLGNDIARMRDQLNDLTAAKNQMYRCLENLNSMWVGVAHDVFINQSRSDEVVLQSLLSNLQNLVECMQNSQLEYERCREEVNNKIASIRLWNEG